MKAYIISCAILLSTGCAAKSPEATRSEFKGLVSAVKAVEEADRAKACEVEYKRLAEALMTQLKSAKSPAGAEVNVKVTAPTLHCRNDSEAIKKYVDERVWTLIRDTK